MLEEKRTYNFNGSTVIDDTTVERYMATIDSENPENLNFSVAQVNKQMRKDNREECRKNQAQFEDDVYAEQDAIIAQDAVKSED